MFVTLITDCSDQATMGRSLTRISTLFDSNITPVGVDKNGKLSPSSFVEAAFNLVDILDASGGEKGVVLVNVAPRSGLAKKWKNGTPFGYFYYNNTLVCSSIDGGVLSLVKKLGVVDKLEIWDIPEVMEYIKSENILESDKADYIKETQFRSFEFLPRVARWTWDKVDVPTKEYIIDDVKIDNEAAVIDNFGNIKSTILPEEIQFKPGNMVELAIGRTIKCYKRLKDVPNNELALVIGSSGISENRFLELVVQGASAHKETGIHIGDNLLMR